MSRPHLPTSPAGYSDAGRLDEPEAAYLRVLETRERILASDDHSLATTLNNSSRYTGGAKPSPTPSRCFNGGW